QREDRFGAEPGRIVEADERVHRREPEGEGGAVGTSTEERAEHRPGHRAERDVQERERLGDAGGHEAAERPVRERLDEPPHRAGDGAGREAAEETLNPHQSPGPKRHTTLKPGRRPLWCTAIAMPMPRSPQKKIWIGAS